MVNNRVDWFPALIRVAEQASSAVLEIYHRSHIALDIHTKRDHSPVTEADVVAQDILMNGLNALDLNIPIVSEESQLSAKERLGWPRYWCIDPLDGTREFIRHTGEFCINIGLIEDHQPVLGLIYVPLEETCYVGLAGHGAFKQKKGQEPVPINVRARSDEPLVVAASRHASPHVVARLLAKLGKYEIIHTGSAIKFCWIAEGRADLYIRLGDTSEWDTAAGQCILEAAGGAVVDLQGKRLRYNEQASFINAHFIALSNEELFNHLNEIAKLT